MAGELEEKPAEMMLNVVVMAAVSKWASHPARLVSSANPSTFQAQGTCAKYCSSCPYPFRRRFHPRTQIWGPNLECVSVDAAYMRFCNRHTKV